MTHNEFENNGTDFEEKKFNQLALNSEVLTQKIIPLLEERLIVNFTQRKTGEVVVRKVVETKIVNINIPVRSEKLIVEQVTPTYKQLATVELGESTSLTEQKFHEKYPETLRLISSEEDSSIAKKNHLFQTGVKGEVSSLEDAHKFLDSVFPELFEGSKILKIELILRKSSPEVT
jgi:stress response protein YsnF